MQVGDVIQGTITGVQKYGLFVENKDLNFKGLVHISECSHDFIADLAEIYEVGQSISCVIVDIDPANERISLSISALRQKKLLHDLPKPSPIHAYRKFYWTNKEENIGFQSIASVLPLWKAAAKKRYHIQ
ncbi:S1 RNA-binding domain-containing protein [Pediococcus cellicola]|uniref:S1 motif domain-containing protein n=1 Tax=Pediococcus cellicola TaxID=319652 RepID=A0A0R2IJJ6_9LACO|nr:S1 RNA-binding domain-containing protein [Pediococcus cellicola]KRN64923.1 hypothetical protein IV80_GL000620 [Pediococcus cellicola]GEL16060.1 RNA-binding protein [Pediococcus cellicola]